MEDKLQLEKDMSRQVDDCCMSCSIERNQSIDMSRRPHTDACYYCRQYKSVYKMVGEIRGRSHSNTVR